MSTTAIEKVQEAIARATEDGGPIPGRPRLIELTQLSEYKVRTAMEKLGLNRPAQAADAKLAVGLLARPDSTSGSVSGELPMAGGASGTLDHQPPPVDHQPPPADHQPAPAAHQPSEQTAKAPRAPRPWPLLFIGLAAAVAVWSGWVGLGQLAGFGVIQPLPGIWDELRINTAVVLPISVEAYAAYALRCWLSGSQFSSRTTSFARWSAISSLVIGAGAQVAYHLMAAAGLTRAPWQITMIVACIPVVVLGMATALAKMVTSDRQAGDRW